MLALDNIQGIVLQGFRPTTATFMFLGSADAARTRAGLRAMLDQIGSAQTWAQQPAARLSIAVTAAGLAALGAPASVLDSFPQAFRQGMAARAGLLGDVGPNAPVDWEVGNAPDALHLLIIVEAKSPSARDDRARTLLEGAAAAGLHTVWRADCDALDQWREHFGFADDVTTVPVAGVPGAAADALQPGEFVLGQPGEYGRSEPVPAPDTIGRDGAFIVVRKYRQHVHAFRSTLRAKARSPQEIGWLAAKMVGRWPDGAPLALYPDTDPGRSGRTDAFGYASDTGDGCPMGAHIRRANPRDGTNVADVAVRGRRMQRRGVPYGPPLAPGAEVDDGVDRGMVFAAVVASIANQFEFVQREWFSQSRHIPGKSSKQGDPLLGGTERPGSYGFPQRLRLNNLPDFVTLRGGEYCFLPSLAGLRAIAEDRWT